MSSTKDRTTNKKEVMKTDVENKKVDAKEIKKQSETKEPVKKVAEEKNKDEVVKPIGVRDQLKKTEEKKVEVDKRIEKKPVEAPKLKIRDTSAIVNEKPKKKNVVGTIFGLTLTCATLGFGYVVADYFYFQPMKQAGIPVYGTRLEQIKPLNRYVLDKVSEKTMTKEGVKNVSIKDQGEVVYVSVTTDGLSLEKARQVAEEATLELIKESGTAIKDYTIQVLVTKPNAEQLLETNREKEDLYVKTHKVGIVETIIAHTEKYPTAANLQRSQANINILNKKYPEEAAKFQSRINALKEYTAEEEAALEIPTLIVDQTVPTSDLAEFPSWGVYDVESLTVTWY